MKTNWTDFAAKKFLGQYFQGEEPLSKKLEDKVDAIAEFYFKNGIEFESQEGFKNLTDAFGDSGFLYGTHLMAEYDFRFFNVQKVSTFRSLLDKLVCLTVLNTVKRVSSFIET